MVLFITSWLFMSLVVVPLIGWRHGRNKDVSEP